MTKKLHWILPGLMALWVLSSMRAPKERTDFNSAEFGRLPVLLNGRVQPLDSVAFNALLQMRGTTSVPLEGNAGRGAAWGDFLALRDQFPGTLEERKWWQFTKHPKRLKPVSWLLEVAYKPELADNRHIFLIHHPELISELKLQNQGVENSGLRYYTFNELTNHFEVLEQQTERIRKIDPQARTPFEKSAAKLHFSLGLYHRLRNSFRHERSDDPAAQLAAFEKALVPGVEAARNRENGVDYSKEDLDALIQPLEQYDMISRVAYPLIIPPPGSDHSRDAWSNLGAALLQAPRAGMLHPATRFFASLASSFRQNQPEKFNKTLSEYGEWLAAHSFGSEVQKGRREFAFNQLQPFYKCMVIYVLALILACASWFNWSETLNRTAFSLLTFGLVVHSGGLLFRMILEGRPPVTNLYSSAIFVGWGTVVLGLVLERIYRNAIGSVVAGLVGFITLIIAHHLSMDGDTMEMLRAVLDTNLWLATHVVVITLGYSATFVAGFLATIYIVRGIFTKSLSRETAQILGRMVYGIICFGTLFSFVGTILGGIWADQSWGRFWGWDPKENGALLIVIWCAVILHARWGGIIKERGLMAMAVFGNIVTSFSWFGVNMLGVGLHNYGFMEAVFQWLTAFVVSQLVLIGLCLLPEKYWSSFQAKDAPAGPSPSRSSGPGSYDPLPQPTGK